MSSGGNFGFTANLDVTPLPSLPSQPAIAVEFPTASTPETMELQSASERSATPQSSLVSGPSLLSIRRVSPRWEIIGVVDVNRVLAALPTAPDSPDARENAIQRIQRAVAVCATAHGCAIVLDMSGNTEDGVPVVLSAVEKLDLTEEVAQQLR